MHSVTATLLGGRAAAASLKGKAQAVAVYRVE